MMITNDRNIMYYLYFKEDKSIENRKYLCNIKATAYVSRDLNKSIKSVKLTFVYENKIEYNLAKLYTSLKGLPKDGFNVFYDGEAEFIVVEIQKSVAEEVRSIYTHDWEEVLICAVDLDVELNPLGIELII